VDQGGEICLELDTAFLPRLRRQPSALATVYLGLQPGQFSAAAGPIQINQPLVIAHLADQVDQDRRESGQARPLHLFPDGGGVDHAEFVRGHPETNPAIDSAGAGVMTQPLGEIDDRIRDQEGD